MEEQQRATSYQLHGRTYREMEDGTIYCDRRQCPGSTGLRCQRTNVPICMQCAVQTPVGYISKDAAREQENKYFNIGSSDYVIAAVVAFFATFLSGLIISLLLGGFGFFAFFILFFVGASIGGSIGEIVMRSINNKRGRYTGRVVGTAMVIATLLLIPVGGFIVILFGIIATGAAISRFEIALRA